MTTVSHNAILKCANFAYDYKLGKIDDKWAVQKRVEFKGYNKIIHRSLPFKPLKEDDVYFDTILKAYVTINSAIPHSNGGYVYEITAENNKGEFVYTKEPDNKEAIIETLERAAKVLQREVDGKDTQIKLLNGKVKSQKEIITKDRETIEELHSQINSLKEKLDVKNNQVFTKGDVYAGGEKIQMSSVYGEGGRTSFTPIKVDKFNMDAIETPFSIHRRGILIKFADDGTITFTSDD